MTASNGRSKVAVALPSLKSTLVPTLPDVIPSAVPEHLTRVRLSRQTIPRDLWFGGGLLLFFIIAAVAAVEHFGDSLSFYLVTPAYRDLQVPPGPSSAHPFGVMNNLGVDILQAVWQATPFDLALVAAVLGTAGTVGIVLGAIAGLGEGGMIDLTITFVSDAVTGIPVWILALVLFVGISPAIGGYAYPAIFVLIFSLILWPYYARPVRSRAIVVAGERYVESARASGSGQSRLLFTHVLPNSLAPALAQFPVDVMALFFVLIVYPYFTCGRWTFPHLGVSVPPTITPLPFIQFPEWGFLTAVGVCSGWNAIPGLDAWWMYLFPVLPIVLLGIGVAFACDGLAKILISKGMQTTHA